MIEYMRQAVAWMARAHDAIARLNDRFAYGLTDKQLHFVVIGALGLLLILLVYPAFRWLAARGRVLAISWVYALTVMVALTFAIEIGQYITGAGSMEFGDIVAGLGGFFAVTAVLAALRLVTWAVKGLFGLGRRRHRRARTA